VYGGVVVKAGVLKETWPGETRVALVPGVVGAPAKAGIETLVESGAGEAAGFLDSLYAEKGATVAGRDEVLQQAALLLSVRSFAGAHDRPALDQLGPQHVLVGFLDPLQQPEAVKTLAARGLTSFALELVPRISRAQSMDALSSTATMVGYKAVLLAADRLPRMMPMMMTAAGTIAPARVFVIGAGVAGLQAIATARRLGAVVEAYDVRPAVREQVQSLGAKFVELPLETQAAEDKGGYAKAQDEGFYRRQRELLTRVVAESDVVIAAAAVPGKKAPVLLTSEMLRGMRPGSVIVDLAAEQGGNCEASEAGREVVAHGARVIAPVNLAASIPHHASQLYARNLANFVQNLAKKGELALGSDDEIVRDSMLTRGGEIVAPRVREALGLSPLSAPAVPA
jgi:NAD(P) transhydrogenase subunit alpha